ncbi:MAG: hypothetical protein WEC59_04920 [Salibacteraceae bacterium]
MKSPFPYLVLSFCLVLTMLSSQAQNEFEYEQKELKTSLKSQTALLAYVHKKIGNDFQIKPFHHASSLTANHSSYQIMVDSILIHRAIIKWSRYNDQREFLSYPILPDEAKFLRSSSSQLDMESIKELTEPGEIILKKELQWFLTDEGFEKRWRLETSRNGQLNEIILDKNLEIEKRIDLTLYDKPDSVVTINIYRPDPVTRAEDEYGGTYIDANDAANQSLIDAMDKATIELRWNVEKGLWELLSDHAKADDFSGEDGSQNPSIAPPTFLKPHEDSLQINRSHPYFEYYNAFYHINQTQQFLNNLGFKNLVDYPLPFDAHASLNDQSSFSPSDTLPQLRFGDGGVDDAEDADVIIHEYGHAISYSAAPNTNFGSERSALDEGFCDYLALSYARRITDYNRNNIFNWDGHNEFWDGRSLTNDRTYPTDKQNDIYADGLLWTSALAEISDYIGLETTDQIMINSLFDWYPNMKLSDATRLFMRSDTLLNDAANSEIASIIFCNRGLLFGCEDTNVSELPINAPYLGNTYDFAYNNDPLFIFPNGQEIQYIDIFDTKGNLIYDTEWNEPRATFYPFDGNFLRQGFYIMRIHTNDGVYPFKICRLWL